YCCWWLLGYSSHQQRLRGWRVAILLRLALLQVEREFAKAPRRVLPGKSEIPAAAGWAVCSAEFTGFTCRIGPSCSALFLKAYRGIQWHDYNRKRKSAA